MSALPKVNSRNTDGGAVSFSPPKTSRTSSVVVTGDVIKDMRDAAHTACRSEKSQRSSSSSTGPAKSMPRVLAFGHSLERNGANICLFYLVRELCEQLSFKLYSLKEGAMRADYEALGVEVRVCGMSHPAYAENVRAALTGCDYAIANTIMTTETVNAAHEMGILCLWIIHEAWPKAQLNYYAKDVFMTRVGADSIREAFTNASKIVFPARVQQSCYAGLFREPDVRVIYNYIPQDRIAVFRASHDRDAVRAALGYGADDIVLVQIGTVCKRKAQLVTCEAFARLHASGEVTQGRRYKLLMVGARYIRQHEIEYISQCKRTLLAAGASDSVTILDTQQDVLPYYFAADIVLCPSVNEVLPLAICEAMAFERPVVVTRIDGIPEAVSHGVHGLVVEPNDVTGLHDAILKLSDDAALRKRMGAAGRKRVLAQFSYARWSKSYRDLIGGELAIDLGQQARTHDF